MKQIAAILLALSMLTVLVGCGAKNDGGAANTAKAPEQSAAEETKEDQSSDLIRPEIKEAIDAYEVFIDEYCAFMKDYDATDISKLAEMSQLLTKEAEMAEKFEAIREKDLNDAEMLYYSEVSVRCSQKMLEILQNRQ